jgi:hypothetical protein
VIASIVIRSQPCYRRDAFESGLRRAGYRIAPGARPQSPRDLLVAWNRYGASEHLADSWERMGGSVLVCENGYAGKDAMGRQYYAISVHGHNGSGWFPVGEEDRFSALGIELKPWRHDGDYLLVCGQRGVGSREMASPLGWHSEVSARIGKRFPTRVRPHPGRHAPLTSLASDLAPAWACAIWSSSCGVEALAEGVPVFYAAPYWICQEAAQRLPEQGSILPLPLMDDEARLAAMRRMAWGQRSIAEIESGEVFARIGSSIERGGTW